MSIEVTDATIDRHLIYPQKYRMAFAGVPMVRPVRQCQRKLSDTWLTRGLLNV